MDEWESNIQFEKIKFSERYMKQARHRTRKKSQANAHPLVWPICLSKLSASVYVSVHQSI